MPDDVHDTPSGDAEPGKPEETEAMSLEAGPPDAEEGSEGEPSESAPAPAGPAEEPAEDPDSAESEAEPIPEPDSQEEAEEAPPDDEPQEPGAEPPGDADEPAPEGGVPPEIHGIRLPLVGTVPYATFAVLLGGAAISFLMVFVAAVIALGGKAPAAEAGQPSAPAPPERAALPDPAVLARMASMPYEELIDAAALAAEAGQFGEAALLLRAASGREEEGVPRVLLARHRLAGALAELGQYDEALHLCESLRSVSRPGDPLWKHALLTSINALARDRRWKDWLRQVYLLRANTARYPDEAGLNRWLLYCRAAARMEIYLERMGHRAKLYGMDPPRFGLAPYVGRPLMAEDIMVTSGKYGDGSLRAGARMGELVLVSEAAPLGRVLGAICEATGLEIRYDGPTEYPVVASLEAIAPEHALEMVLGSVGLQAREQGEAYVVEPLDPRPRSDADALSMALWSLQEFLILHPESASVPECYYAVAQIYMMQGQPKMGLGQLEVLGAEAPRSIWCLYGHYLAGRARAEREEWATAERELLLVADTDPDHPLTQSAFLWAAQCQVELGKYEQAVGSFRRALAYETPHPLAPRILFNIAFCLEKSAASPLEVEERYLEVRTRYPETEYARQADYRLARMALDAADYRKAVARYEFYLSNWPVDGELGRNACRDAILAYVRTGDTVRAVLLAEIMSATFGQAPQYWQAMPYILEAYDRAGLRKIGLDVVERSLEAAEDPARRGPLLVEKARLLIDLKETDEAEALLAEAEADLDPNTVYAAWLQKARIMQARSEEAAAVELCRQVALHCPDEEVRAEAVRMIARHFADRQQFDRAALAFAGHCPTAVTEEIR